MKDSSDTLSRLRISSAQKRRSGGLWWLIAVGVLILTAMALYYAYPRASDSVRSGMKSGREEAVAKADRELAERAKKLEAGRTAPSATRNASGNAAGGVGTPQSTSSSPSPTVPGEPVLTVSGYVIARERIELSPRFLGVVTWIGVRKGDTVTNGQVVVRLDESENRARLTEIEAQIQVSKVALDRAQMDFRRAQDLVNSRVEMQKMLDDARLAVAAAEAQYQQAQSARKLIETYLSWCVIRSPIDGVVLEKLVDVNELVTPQTFGSGRGPSTSLLAVADLTDLQVEIDVNEADLAKVRLGQRCRVSPEAYPDKQYRGIVAEIAPEANRAKGTLSVKVKVQEPDRYLTPELSAKVQFLAGE